MDGKLVGILGGGQLGRMLAASASLLNIGVIILDVGENSPAKQVVLPQDASRSHIDGSFTDPQKILELARKVDTLTIEIEHVNVDSLEEALRREFPNVPVNPSPSTIRIIQDKLRQKQHLEAHGSPLGPFIQIESTAASLDLAIKQFGLPLMLKSRTQAYDGRGNFVLRDESLVQEAISVLGDRPLYAEKWVPFEKEIAVMVVRSSGGEVRSYPAVETVHKDSICHLVFAPLRSRDVSLSSRARAIAEAAVRTFEGAGVFGVEMFLLPNESLLINEIAPRPHNSGHYTIEACETSQYENHLRAILGLPLGSTALKVPSAAMVNLLGASSNQQEIRAFARAALEVPGASVHLYGKAESRKGRKMGHVTVVADSDAQLLPRVRALLSALPGGSSTAELDRFAPIAPAPGSGRSHTHPLVGIIMGSDSDLPVMLPAARILDRFGVPYELTIVSAHRTPDRMVAYARAGASRGLCAIIAGAGGAAHLPGMVAALTALPVIGVPVKGSTLDGVDSLHSIVQMPRGIPVATVAINNSTNAALLAVRILGSAMPRVLDAMDRYLKSLEGEVMGKVERLEEVGWEKYEVKKG